MKGNKIYRLVREAASMVAGLSMLCAMSSCREELELLNGASDDVFTVTVGADIVAANVDRSRATENSNEFSDGLENPAGASIVIIAFDENHNLTNVYKGTYQKTVTNDESQQVYYTVNNMVASDQKRIFHIIVNHNDLDINAIKYGSEATIMNSTLMIVDEGKDVYWRKIEIEKATKENVIEALKHVYLVRNYAKLVLDVKNLTEDGSYQWLPTDASEIDENKTYIEKVEWGLMAVPTKGYVAPYISDNDFAKYVHTGTTTNKLNEAYTYNELYSENYRCNVPRLYNSDTIYRLCNAEDAASIVWKDSSESIYQFENEGYSDADDWKKTLVMIKVTTNKKDEWYYRIALTDASRNYESLFIFRNVQYNIQITGVMDSGFDTPAEAYTKAAANNISGSTITADFTNVTLNSEALRVEYVKKYILKPGAFSMKARYVPDTDVLNGSTYKADNDKLLVGYADEYDTNGTEPAYVGTTADGFAISSAAVATDDIEGSNYRYINFEGNTPLRNQQSVTSRVRVYVDSNRQLYRNIEFILRERYKIKNMEITRDDYTESTDESTDNTYNKNCFTLTVEIPAGLPEELFPLTFNFQTDPECVYPNANRSIMEVDGTEVSMFDRKSTDSFVYHRDVTYEHYMDTERFKRENGYVRITFFFKILDVSLTGGESTITFGVDNDAFSIEPDEDLGAENPQILQATFKYSVDDKGYITLDKVPDDEVSD